MTKPVRLSDGSRVNLTLAWDARWGAYDATCYVVDTCLVSAQFTPGRGFHDGCVHSDELGAELANAADNMIRAKGATEPK
jgi:hypothetical protein